MRSASIRLSGLLTLGLLLGVGPARAEFIDWSYHWSIGPAPVLASGTGTVAQALYRGGNESGAQILRAAAVTTSSSATVRNPDHFDKSFNLVLHLTDAQSHLSSNLTFHGTITGFLTAKSSNLTESFRDSTQRVTIGAHQYNVVLPSHLALLRPGAPVIPILAALVSVQDTRQVHPAFQMSDALFIHTASISPAPEPSAFALAGIAVLLLGCWYVRRCRRLLILTASLADPCG
jgi:hypothetical protein